MVARVIFVLIVACAAVAATAQGWRAARQGETANVSVGLAAYVWIERLRQPTAPVTTFSVTGPQGNSWQFEHGLLTAGDYAFTPNGNFDAASSWRVRASTVVDGARAGATRETALTLNPNQPARFLPAVNASWVSVTVPKAGRAEVHALTGSLSQELQWLDANGKTLAKGTTASFLGPCTAFVSLHVAQADTVAVVRFLPNEDALEPNNASELAMPIAFGAWHRVSLSQGDEDWFELDVARGSEVTVSVLGLPSGERPEIAWETADFSSNYPFPVTKGRHRVALKQGNVSRADTFLVRFDARRKRTTLNPNRPVTVATTAYPATYTFPLRLDEPSRLDIVLSGAPVGSAVAWTVANDKTNVQGGPNRPAYLAPGTYTLLVAVNASDEPRSFRITPAVRTVKNEPNDAREQAIGLDVPSSFLVHFGYAGDADWFILNVSEKGLLRVRQPDSAVHSAADIGVQLYKKDSDEAVPPLPVRTDRFDYNFAVEKGEYHLRLQRSGVLRNPEALEVAFHKHSEVKESTEGGVGIALVGFGVKTGDGNWMETLAQDSAIEFISADESKDLGADLAASLERKEEMIAGKPWLRIVLIALGALVALWIVFKVLASRNKRPRPEPAP